MSRRESESREPFACLMKGEDTQMFGKPVSHIARFIHFTVGINQRSLTPGYCDPRAT